MIIAGYFFFLLERYIAEPYYCLLFKDTDSRMQVSPVRIKNEDNIGTDSQVTRESTLGICA